MAHWVKALTNKTENLSQIPQELHGREENQFTKAILSLHLCMWMCVCEYMHANILKKNIVLKQTLTILYGLSWNSLYQAGFELNSASTV